MATSSRGLAIVLSLLLVSSIVVTPITALESTDRTAATADHASDTTEALSSTADATEDDADRTDDVPVIDGNEPQDLTGDGRYEDLTGSGTLTMQDLQVFFANQHRSPMDDHPEYFDYAGNGEVGQVDGIRLFEAIGASDLTDVIEPRITEDSTTNRSARATGTTSIEHTDETTGVTVNATGNGTTPELLDLEALPQYHDGTAASAGPTVAVSNVELQESVQVRLPVTEDVSESDVQVYERVPNGTAQWVPTETEYDASAGEVRTNLTAARQVTVLNASAWEADRSVSIFDAESASNVSLENCHEECRVVGDSIVIGSDIGTERYDDGSTTPMLCCPPAPGPDLIDEITDKVGDIIDEGEEEEVEDEEDDQDTAPRHPPDDYDPYDDEEGDDSDDGADDGSDDTASTNPGDDTDSGDDDERDSSDEKDTESDDSDSDDSVYEDEDEGVEDEEERADDTTVEISVPLEPEAVKLTTWYSTANGGDVEIDVEGTETTQTESVDETGGTVDVLTADVAQFGGEDVTVSVRAEGTIAEIHGVTLFHDTTGDGLVDVFEREPQLHPVTGNPIRTDPTREDTNGDGLADAEQIDAEFDGTEWVLTEARADPTMVDSDGDGLTDYEELHVWETDPLDPDTSGDGLIDLVDPNPHEETTPPELAFEPLTEIQTVDPYASEDLTLAVTASATDAADAIESVTVETCWEDPPGDVREEQDRECQSAPIVSDAVDSDAIDTQLPSASSVRVPFSLYYYDDGTRIPDAPDEITVTAVDDDGTAVATHVDTVEREVEATASVQAAGAGAVQNVRTAQVTTSLPSAAQAGFFAQLTLVAGGALALDAAAESVGEDLESGTAVHEEFHAVPGTEVQGQWELPEHGVEVTLPSGAAYEHPELPEQDRKHGWEQVKELPGIEQPSDVGEIVENGEHLPGHGEHDLVIGDNPNEPGQILLRLAEGLVLSADHGVRDSTRDQWVHIPEHTIHKIANERNDWDHNQIGRGEQSILENIRNIVGDPDEIHEDPYQDRWMYVKRIVVDGKELIAVAFVQNGEVATSFVPTHGDYSGSLGYSEEHAKWYIESQNMIKQYVPGEEIVSNVGIGEQPPDPGHEPDPT